MKKEKKKGKKKEKKKRYILLQRIAGEDVEMKAEPAPFTWLAGKY